MVRDDQPPHRQPRVARVERLVLPDGRALCVRRWPGPGEPVVLLHGLLDSSEGWSELCGQVGRSLIAFDLPGFGYSDAPPRGSLETYARDIADGLSVLGVERFALVGHSLGGAVAAVLADLVPAQVTDLVLLAPVGFGHIRIAELVSLPGVRRLVRAAMPFAFSSRLAVTAAYVTMVSDGTAPDSATVDRVVRAGPKLVAGAHEGIRAVADAGRAAAGFAGRGHGFGGPVLAVWGDRDRLVPASHGDAVRRALPQARLELWRGMGHHPMKERFRDLVALVERVAGAETVSAPVAPADALAALTAAA